MTVSGKCSDIGDVIGSGLWFDDSGIGGSYSCKERERVVDCEISDCN